VGKMERSEEIRNVVRRGGDLARRIQDRKNKDKGNLRGCQSNLQRRKLKGFSRESALRRQFGASRGLKSCHEGVSGEGKEKLKKYEKETLFVHYVRVRGETVQKELK